MGEEALAESCLVVVIETERPHDEIIMVVVVVEYYFFLINIIVGAPLPRPPHLYLAKLQFLIKNLGQENRSTFH